jgi:hypothetical protein
MKRAGFATVHPNEDSRRSEMDDRMRGRGLSPVEVLVLVAVVGVGIALTLPAIRASQIFARRARCINNLKQIGLACHNYHDVNGTLPMSRVAGTKGHGVGHSSHTALLPFLELAPVYNAYNFSLEPWHASNNTVTRTKLAVYLCPDNKGPTGPMEARDVPSLDDKGVPGKNQFVATHYGANWGGGHEGFGDDFVKAKGTYLGMIVPVSTPEGAEAGVKANIRFADVPDGLSNTIMVAEKGDGGAWAVGGFGNSEFDVNTSPAYDGDDAKAKRVFTGSPHEAGPNILMGDGSVRALSPKTEKDVWYALITRNGGEVIRPEDLKP